MPSRNASRPQNGPRGRNPRFLMMALAFLLVGGMLLWGIGVAMPVSSVQLRLLGNSALPADPQKGIEVPDGMVFVPGGETEIGSVEGNPDEQPVFRTTVRPFFMDRHPVTVAQYRAFVEATGYVTEAEKFGDAGVFDPEIRGWRMVKGATWHHPFGPDRDPAPDDHPVTQVSWNDAVAYASWIGKRLPSEVEWEHAARGGQNRKSRYAWGDELHDEHGRARANTYEGIFPHHDSGADGYRGTSPVGAFGETELGLVDMGGNVWEWAADWYRPYAERTQPFHPSPASEKVQRGGSYLCSPNFCHGYRVSARSHSTPETALAHLGFRLVEDLPVQ